MPSKNHYKTLGLSQTADEKEIKRRFRELARKYHPDMNGSQNTARFHEINEAYQVLSDRRKRARYDMELREKQRQAMEASSGAAPRPQRPAPRPGERYSSHRRPPQPEPEMGPVRSSQATTQEALAGIALLAGMIACAAITFTFLQILNVLAGDQQTVTIQQADADRNATIRAIEDEQATLMAIPTTTPAALNDVRDLSLENMLVQDDDLYQILHSTRPLLSNYCTVNLTEETRPCTGSEARRINTISGSTVDGRVSVEVEMDRQSDRDTAMRRVVFIVEFGSQPGGLSLNIGDSREVQGDGRAAYAGAPSDKAEIVIDNGDLRIYGYTDACNNGSSTLLYAENDFVSAGSRLIIEVSDQRVRWINDVEGRELVSRCLFQLGGQTLNGDSPNWKIYAGFNRAIRTGSTQRGRGLASASIYLLTENRTTQ